MDNIFDIIKSRYSVRTYSERPIESEKLKALKEYLEANTKGPFGGQVRYMLVDVAENSENELKKYISYGNVKGARLFIAGTVKKGQMAMEDFGYTMEQNVLFATSLGLGTVWLGGSLNRSSFSQKLGASNDEVILAVTPVGYAADKRTLMDKLIRTMSGGKNRKEFNRIFFHGNVSSPLDKTVCGKYADPLEAVRLAPSASNKQPWRIIKERDRNVFHFYMDEHKSNNAYKDIKPQNNDMGIAMCHFELTARELGLQGSWKKEKPGLEAGSPVYIVSWIGE